MSPRYQVTPRLRDEFLAHAELKDDYLAALLRLRAAVVEGTEPVEPADAACLAAQEAFWSRWTAWYQRSSPETDPVVAGLVIGLKCAATALNLDWLCLRVGTRHANDADVVALVLGYEQLAQVCHNAAFDVLGQLINRGSDDLASDLQGVSEHYKALIAGIDKMEALLEGRDPFTRP